MRSIVVINVYFGTYPNYFPLWVKSAAANPTVDFLLVTDQALSDLPANIKTLKMTLSEFCALATKKIGIEVSFTRPYKLCDFKVTYGLVFEDYIQGYDFWGHCDVDVIWGDLRKFITDQILEQYDRVLLWGHLSLYRNRKDVNKRFMLDGGLRGDYKTVLQSDKSFAFDESTGITSIYKKHGFTQFDGDFVAGIDTKYKRFRLNIAERNYKHQVFYYENGHILRAYYSNDRINTDEFAYIHLHQRKYEDFSVVVDSAAYSFFITNNGFYTRTGKAVSLTEIKRMNRYKGALYEKAEQKVFRMKQTKSERKKRKEIIRKKYQYLHIYYQHDFKFGLSLIEFLENKTTSFDKHLFVTRDIDVALFYWKYDNFIYDERAFYRIINDYGKTVKRIFLHSFFAPKADIFRVKCSIIKKIVWRTWGHDQRKLISTDTVAKRALGLIPNYLFANRIRKFYGVGIGSVCDRINLKRLFGEINTFYLPYETDAFVKVLKRVPETTREDAAPIKVLVGHSGLSYLNHIKILKKLQPYLENNILVYVVLAYGHEGYIQDVKQFIESMGSKKVIAIQKYVPLEEYVNFLDSVDIAVFDQTGSAALGNIYLLAYLGKKLYLNNNGIIKKEFDELKIEYGVTNDIGRISFEEFSKSLENKEQGKKAYSFLVDENWTLDCWNRVLNIKANT